MTRSLHYAWIILFMGTLAVFGVLGLGRFGYTSVLPAMQKGLSMSNTQAGILATVNLVGYLALSVIGGALASHLGPRRVISGGLVVAGAGMVFTGAAESFGGALLWRAVTGIGSGAGNVSVMGLMAAWFASRRRGLASGVAVSGSSIAIILIGPLVPRIIASHGEAGWRVCWQIFGGATLILGAAAWLLLRDRPGDVGLNSLGASPGDSPPPSPSGAVSWGKVYRARHLWHLGLVYVAFGFSYIIYMTFFTKRLTAEGGYTPAGAGGLFMVMGWFSLGCGLIWGAVSDRIGRKLALVIVYLVQAAAIGLFALPGIPIAFVLSAALFGLTAWSIPAIMAAACGDVLGPRLAPAALGFITLFFGIGQAAGPGVAGAIADAAGSFSPAFALAALVALMGALGSWRLHRADGMT